MKCLADNIDIVPAKVLKLDDGTIIQLFPDGSIACSTTEVDMWPTLTLEEIQLIAHNALDQEQTNKGRSKDKPGP